MKYKMKYKGCEIKIWDGKRGLGLQHNSYIAQTIDNPIITVRRNSISELREAIKDEIDRSK